MSKGLDNLLTVRYIYSTLASADETATRTGDHMEERAIAQAEQHMSADSAFFAMKDARDLMPYAQTVAEMQEMATLINVLAARYWALMGHQQWQGQWITKTGRVIKSAVCQG